MPYNNGMDKVEVNDAHVMMILTIIIWTHWTMEQSMVEWYSIFTNLSYNTNMSIICHLYNTNIKSVKNIELDAKHV